MTTLDADGAEYTRRSIHKVYFVVLWIFIAGLFSTAIIGKDILADKFAVLIISTGVSFFVFEGTLWILTYWWDKSNYE